MANTVSSIKRNRITERRTLINKARKSRLRHHLRNMRKLLDPKSGNADQAQAALPKVFSAVDRAAKTGIIKKNTASRYKSRLTKRVKAMTATAA
jgi:small subunit ribosomal protein S20